MWITQPEGILLDRLFFEKACEGRPIWFRLLKLAFSNNSRGPGQWVTLHMQIKSEFLQILLKKNKQTNFTASISEVVRGLFLPPAKLRPQKNFWTFANRKRVYRCISNNLNIMKKVNISCHSFQKVKPIYDIDSLHRVKYIKPLFLEILMIMASR